MKKFIFFLFLLFFLIPLVSATSVYDQINTIKSDPSPYTIVIGNQADIETIKASSELASFLGITRSLFDNEVQNPQNLVLIGNPSNNVLIVPFISPDQTNKTTIKAANNNLIINNMNPSDLKQGIDLIKNYEKNKEILQTEEYLLQTFFSPSDSSLLILIIVSVLVLALIGILTFIIIKKRKHIETKLVTTNIQPQELNQQIIYYIQKSMQQGYSKDQIKQSLINVGWNSSQVDQALSRF
jgi:hypothetical protein